MDEYYSFSWVIWVDEFSYKDSRWYHRDKPRFIESKMAASLFEYLYSHVQMKT